MPKTCTSGPPALRACIRGSVRIMHGTVIWDRSCIIRIKSRNPWACPAPVGFYTFPCPLVHNGCCLRFFLAGNFAPRYGPRVASLWKQGQRMSCRYLREVLVHQGPNTFHPTPILPSCRPQPSPRPPPLYFPIPPPHPPIIHPQRGVDPAFWPPHLTYIDN